jgi:hypothetical protein
VGYCGVVGSCHECSVRSTLLVIARLGLVSSIRRVAAGYYPFIVNSIVITNRPQAYSVVSAHREHAMLPRRKLQQLMF